MSRTNLALVVIGLLAGLGVPALAQDAGGNRPRTPEEFRARMEQRMKEQLGVTDDEWKVLQPKIQKVNDLRRQTSAGFGGMRGGRRGGDNPPPTPDNPTAKAAEALRTALENKDTAAADIKAKLTAFREARDKAREELAKAQKDLKDVLTGRQEAALVMMNIVD